MYPLYPYQAGRATDIVRVRAYIHNLEFSIRKEDLPISTFPEQIDAFTWFAMIRTPAAEEGIVEHKVAERTNGQGRWVFVMFGWS